MQISLGLLNVSCGDGFDAITKSVCMLSKSLHFLHSVIRIKPVYYIAFVKLKFFLLILNSTCLGDGCSSGELLCFGCAYSCWLVELSWKNIKPALPDCLREEFCDRACMC